MDNYTKTDNLAWFLFAGGIFTFLKAQVSAFTGGVCDYAIMILVTTYGHIFYGYSIIISGTIGAIINFLINRYWTFNGTGVSSWSQLQKFIVVVAGSILLKSSGTWLLTTLLGLDYRISRICIDICISLGFNFTLQNYWVFRK
jgi:putative flippase GtrA